MDTALLLLRFALALVFAAAAVGKFLDLSGSRAAMTGFGVPARLAVVVGVLLPATELGVALALIPATTARWAAAGALVLLLGFIGGIARALAQGQTPDCHCFGQLHSAPAGRGALARNVALAALAAVVVVRGPGPTLGAWRSDHSAAEVAAVAIGACLAALLLLWLRRRIDARRQAPEPEPGLPVGSPAPDFEALRSGGHPVALVFMEPGCGPCQALMPEIGRWRESLSDALAITVMEDRKVAQAYGIQDTPAAVVVSPAGTVASAPAVGAPAIEALIRLSLQRGARVS